MGTRVIGLGQATAGDDGVAFAVLRLLRDAQTPEDTELLLAPDATALLSLLETPRHVILVDAVVAQGPVGRVVEFDAEVLATTPGAPHPVSTHGVDVKQALALARLLSGGNISPSICVVGVTIAPPRDYGEGLSPAIEAAVPAAARAVLARLGANAVLARLGADDDA